MVRHHPAYYGLSFPRAGPPVQLDSFLWDAFAGNARVERLLAKHAARIAFAFCGHTHDERDNTLGPIRGHNIGGDYNHKRLLWVVAAGGLVIGGCGSVLHAHAAATGRPRSAIRWKPRSLIGICSGTGRTPATPGISGRSTWPSSPARA